MVLSAWKKGNLGRFKAEDPSKPTFIFLGHDRSNALVQYHDTIGITKIPERTFQRDFVEWWVPKKVLKPKWLKVGSVITVPRNLLKPDQVWVESKVCNRHRRAR